jgi:hypothetical protein
MGLQEVCVCLGSRRQKDLRTEGQKSMSSGEQENPEQVHVLEPH